MNTQRKWKSRFKKAAVTGLAVIVGAANFITGGCAENKPVISVKTTLASHYIPPSGSVLAEKEPLKKRAVIQPSIKAEFKNGFSGEIWGNYDTQDAKEGYALHQVDIRTN